MTITSVTNANRNNSQSTDGDMYQNADEMALISIIVSRHLQ